MSNDEIILFEDKKIRRIWHENEWFFSVVDIIQVLTDSPQPRKYWSQLKQREFTELQLSPIWRQLKLKAIDGKKYNTDCVNRKGILRLVQSVPSKKAQPFKEWLAQVGEDRLQEIENPELAQDRAKEYYEIKGYPKSWIEKRLRGIAIRQELTGEWSERGAKDHHDFAILTNEISQATFDTSVKDHKELKGITKENENLRDHMTDLELIFTMLGESSTSVITKVEDSQGMEELATSAKKGGDVAGRARKDLEKQIKKSIVSSKNFLALER